METRDQPHCLVRAKHEARSAGVQVPGRVETSEFVVGTRPPRPLDPQRLRLGAGI
jgi:hypothetical protein